MSDLLLLVLRLAQYFEAHQLDCPQDLQVDQELLDLLLGWPDLGCRVLLVESRVVPQMEGYETRPDRTESWIGKGN